MTTVGSGSEDFQQAVAGAFNRRRITFRRRISEGLRLAQTSGFGWCIHHRGRRILLKTKQAANKILVFFHQDRTFPINLNPNQRIRLKRAGAGQECRFSGRGTGDTVARCCLCSRALTVAEVANSRPRRLLGIIVAEDGLAGLITGTTSEVRSSAPGRGGRSLKSGG